MIPMPPLAAAKLSLYTGMREQSISSSDLAVRLQLTEDAARKQFDLRYRTRIRQVEIALLAIGRAVATEDMDLEAAPPKSPELVGGEAGTLR